MWNSSSQYERVGHQEVAHLGAAEVEDQGAPVGLFAAARIRVLVERRAVEAGQRELVAREVRRYPVHDHAVAVLVQVVDEVAEVVRGAEAGGGGVVRGDLVAPGTTERVLGHRQQLDVREAGLVEVLDEFVGQFAVGQPGLPRTEVHLVDAHRLGVRLALGPVGQPLLVLPDVPGLVDDRRGGRWDLGPEGQRVGLLPPPAVPPEHAELVAGAGADVRHEQLPHPGAAQHPHRVRPPGPTVEVAGDPHSLGGRGPDREAGAADGAGRGVVAAHVRPQHVPQPLVPTLADQVQVHVAQGGQPAVRVVDGVDPLAVAHGEPVVRGRAGHHPGEQAGVVHPGQDGLGRRPAAAPGPRRRAGAGSGSPCRRRAGARRAPSAGRGGTPPSSRSIVPGSGGAGSTVGPGSTAGTPSSAGFAATSGPAGSRSPPGPVVPVPVVRSRPLPLRPLPLRPLPLRSSPA